MKSTLVSAKTRQTSFGLLGMGAVGRNVLQNYLSENRSSRFSRNLKWVANSKFLFKAADGKYLTAKNLKWLIRLMKNPSDFSPDSGLQRVAFSSVAEETEILKQETRETESWIVMDSTYMGAEDSYNISSSLIDRVDALISA